MFRQIKKFMLVAIAVGVVMGGTARAFADQARYQEFHQNLTLNAAYDIEKVLWGIHEITYAYSDKFSEYSYDNESVPGFTIITWYGDYDTERVNPDEWVEVCFQTDAGEQGLAEIEVVCAMWTDHNGNFLGYAGAGTTVSAQTPGGKVTVYVKHSGKRFDAGMEGDEMGPITGSKVYYTIADSLRTLEELNGDLWTCHYDGTPSPGESCETDADCTSGGNCGPSDITWVDLDPDGFTISYGDSTQPPYDLGVHPHDAVVLFRFDTSGNTPVGGRGTWSSRELLQFRVYAIPSGDIPAVSEWGMVVIALLVLAAGTIVIRRRRAMSAQA